MISQCHVDTMIYRFKYHFPCTMYTILWYNRPYKRSLIGDEHFVWLRKRNVFGGSIITTYVYVLLLISYKVLLFSWMFAHPILIIWFKYKCMYWHRAWSRKPLPHSQEQCLAPRNLYAAAQYARNRYDSPGCYTFVKLNKSTNIFFILWTKNVRDHEDYEEMK